MLSPKTEKLAFFIRSKMITTIYESKQKSNNI